MSEPFLAEVRIVGFNFPPRGWAQCDGQILPINQFQSLYSLLGTTYGGDGVTTLALPDLRGRTPIHENAAHTLGQRAGGEGHQLASAEMPAHTHAPQGTDDDADSPIPASQVFARATSPAYGSPTSLTPLAPGAVANAGGNQAHQNMQPSLALNFVIAIQGLFPSRN